MKLYANLSTAILISFVLSVIFSPFIISFAKKIKLNQPVYEYVEMHKNKSGTPTMGGLIFLLSITITTLIIVKIESELTLMCICIMTAYGFIGFIDDYLKIKFNHNEGLKPYQKLIGQFIVSFIISVYAYKENIINGEIYIPFTTKILDIGIWYIPFVIFFFLAITNSVNLTDGLDGLAGGVSLIFTIFFLIVFLMIFTKFMPYTNSVIIKEYMGIVCFMGAIIGGMLGYLIYNSHPASVFMGDTGSLALGGMLGCISIVTKNILVVPIIGFMFVLSSVSVIIQVIHYKRTHKRVFLMAPFHHHLEKKSMYETKIVAIYIIVTAMLGVVAILLTAILI